jgi:hypothetical protein
VTRDQDTSVDPSVLSEALIVWTGFGDTAWPSRDERRLVERYGADSATALFPRLRELEDDFYASDARDHAKDLAEMGDLAKAEFRQRHPELTEEAAEALTWCYTFDYR